MTEETLTTIPLVLPAEATPGSLADRAMLVNLTITQWSARATDKKVNREVATQHGSDETMGNYRKCLVAKDAIAAVSQAASAARQEHYRLTLPWRDKGDRILSSTGYFEYAGKMRQLEAQFNACVNVFADNFDAYVQEARAKLSGLFNPADYPSSSEIRSKFSFALEVLPVPQAEDFRVNLGTEETERIKARLEADSQVQVQRALSDVWARMRDVVTTMSERLKLIKQDETTGKVEHPFRDSLVTNITELVSIIPLLNITADPNIAQFAAAINDGLTRYSPDQLRNSQMRRDDTARRADEILAKMAAFVA